MHTLYDQFKIKEGGKGKKGFTEKVPSSFCLSKFISETLESGSIICILLCSTVVKDVMEQSQNGFG